MFFLGCDPGLNGAVAVLNEDGELVKVIDMPKMVDGTKSVINSVSLYDDLLEFAEGIQSMYLERVNPTPADGSGNLRQQGAASAGAFMKAAGMIEATIRIAYGDHRVTKIMPAQWKKRYDLLRGGKRVAEAGNVKKASVFAARELFPGQEKTFLISKADRAEAALMAYLAYVDHQKG